jgi:hypothetical protein
MKTFWSWNNLCQSKMLALCKEMLLSQGKSPFWRSTMPFLVEKIPRNDVKMFPHFLEIIVGGVTYPCLNPLSWIEIGLRS